MLNSYLAGQKLLCGAYTQYTPTGKSLFIKAGRYNKKPQAGDAVYFYSTNMGRVCHVGIVAEVLQNGDIYTIRTIEGNTSSGNIFNRNGGEVAYKEYTFNISEVGKGRINGFGRPLFGADTCTAEDFISIAKKELGYIEKASNKCLEDKKANAGDKNFTKYGAWYGGNGLYWCQQFVSWCAYMACKNHNKMRFTGWEKVDNKWKYRLNGVYISDKWEEIGGRWYVFDNAGNAVTGWFKSNNDWYYLNKDDCAMLSGQWIEDNGKYYYLTRSGLMARNCYVKYQNGNIYHWVNDSGEYKKEYDSIEPDLDKYEVAE